MSNEGKRKDRNPELVTVKLLEVMDFLAAVASALRNGRLKPDSVYADSPVDPGARSIYDYAPWVNDERSK